MALSDINIKNYKPQAKPYKKPDTKEVKSMYLLVHPNGGKYFRLDYRLEGKRRTLALGTYPDVPLTTARERANTARQRIRQQT